MAFSAVRIRGDNRITQKGPVQIKYLEMLWTRTVLAMFQVMVQVRTREANSKEGKKVPIAILFETLTSLAETWKFIITSPVSSFI